MVLLKRPIQLKSLTTLLILLFLGSGVLFLTYYVFTYKTLQENAAFRAEIETLDHELESLISGKVRLSKSPIPTNEELAVYAGMIPGDREVTRFLRSIDDIDSRSGLIIQSLQIQDSQPVSTDILHKLLVFLEERQDSEQPAATHAGREDFIRNLLAQMDEQYSDNETGTTDPNALNAGPLKQVNLQLSYQANDAQLLTFLALLRDLDRIVYIDNLDHRLNAGSVNMTIFYYEGDYPFIPQLP